MSNPSNLYAEKIYAEHPLVLWALDDKADYVSLITEAQRDIDDLWATTGGTTSLGVIGGDPFPESVTTLIEGDIPVGETNKIISISPNLINFTDLDPDLGTFSVGTYFYSESAYLKTVSIGFEYTDTTTSLVVKELKTYTTSLFQNWAFISGTFEIPDENTNARLVIEIDTDSGGSAESEYAFYINGVTFGQWSEEFNTISLGVIPENFPPNIALDTTSKVISAAAYGLSTDQGYYLTKDNSLLAKNTSIPLVYGASGVTKLTPNIEGKPSLIVPGKGFLNELGRYKEYTLEFWARINSDTVLPKRIFGPISGSNGLYVEGGFLTLVVGDNFGSHFVGEWTRPMLIHIRLIRNSVTVLINGEEVISLTIDTESLVLPSPTLGGDSQDWLGFYSYEDVSPFEIDCVAIYSYQVPISVAKRRWVYGQAVLSPEGINSAYGGTSAFFDYSFADYTANYNYPNFAEWQQGTFDNLVTTSTSITTPDYQLPEIFLDGKTLEDFYLDNNLIQSGTDKFITFRPNEDWDSTNPYINFSRLNIINDQVHTVYGIFQVDDDDLTDQILFKFYNTLTGNSFSIRKDGPDIDYYLTYNGTEEEFYSEESFAVGQKMAIGVEIQRLVNFFGGNVAEFFGTQSGIELYVGGDETGEFTFTGKIYSVGLSSSFNALELSSHFNDNGTAIIDQEESGPTEPENARALLDHVASYTLLPTSAYGKFFLDIGVSGYWEDYLPLSYFAQFVENDIGNQFYDLDFLQFNIGYPSPSKLQETEQIAESWTYEDLKNEYKLPIQKTYQQLDNILYTGWADYEDMAQRSVKFYEYDTTQASIRSYLTFQYILDGANLLQSDFSRVESATSSKIIDINEHPLWETTKFEVVDNMLVYPTKTIDFNELAVVFHLEFKLKNILTKPISLNRLEFASQALNNNSFNPVGTRFGLEVFPFTRSGIYFDYKTKNPYSIYKGSTPYLYLNRTSGVEVRGDFTSDVSRGIAVPINQTNASNYRVSAAQLWMRYDEEQFPSVPTELFEIDYKGDTIKFYMVSDSQKATRARIYAINQSNGLAFNGLAYYWNGTLVREPVVTVKEWGVLGIAFSTALNFDSYLGGINLIGPMLFNNVAYYQANNLQQVQSSITRPWLRVKDDGITEYEWLYWLNNFTWDGVLIISESDAYGVRPDEVYKTYLGTNKIIIDDNEGMTFNPDIIKVYNDTIWQTTVKIPV
jgi:hypothetical protein